MVEKARSEPETHGDSPQPLPQRQSEALNPACGPDALKRLRGIPNIAKWTRERAGGARGGIRLAAMQRAPSTKRNGTPSRTRGKEGERERGRRREPTRPRARPGPAKRICGAPALRKRWTTGSDWQQRIRYFGVTSGAANRCVMSPV